ncbi:hypothetical protein M7I_0063 [Glarea lozoyensis 74030]|uniref:Uncharacterized protein n=1 Tax=Glarea lozoyensis (strain ATCC 74030 / MF5533) TaxID=1104152 RepID=H0ECC9_GLAL7|nr:hypothetical protein M7I_0063 [Glarea lozoyensis 74030]
MLRNKAILIRKRRSKNPNIISLSYRDVAHGGVAAEVDADYAGGAVGEGEGDDLVGGGEGGAAVDGEDEGGFHGGVGVGGGDAGEDCADVVCCCDVCGGDGAALQLFACYKLVVAQRKGLD